MVKPITHTIYLKLIVGTHTKSFAFLFIIKLRHYSMIFGQLSIKKYRNMINMTNNIITFWLGHYTYIRASLHITLEQDTLPTEIILTKTT